MITARHELVSLLAALALLAPFGPAGCADDDPAGVDCGPSAEPSEDPDYCVYRGEIIVTGFLCPESHPYRHNISGYVICSDEPLLAPDALAELQAMGIEIGTEPVQSGKSCKEDDTCEDEDEACDTDDGVCVLANPVRLVVLVDQTASRQCTDPTGSLEGAVNDAVAAFLGQPNAAAAAVGFASWANGTPFSTEASDLAAALAIDGFGPATDLQGALFRAIGLVDGELGTLPAADLAKTRVVVVAVTDGAPEPVCHAGCEDDTVACTDGEDNDGDGDVDDADADCAEPKSDNLYGLCNTAADIPADIYIDFGGGCGEYNTTTSLAERAADLVALATEHGAAAVELHTRLWTAPPDAVAAICGNALFGLDVEAATELMEGVANAGGGTFATVDQAAPATLFDGINLAPMP